MHLVATGQVKLEDPTSAYVKHPLTANGATVRETASPLTLLMSRDGATRYMEVYYSSPASSPR